MENLKEVLRTKDSVELALDMLNIKDPHRQQLAIIGLASAAAGLLAELDHTHATIGNGGIKTKTRQRTFCADYDENVYQIAKEIALVDDVEIRIDRIMQYVRHIDAIEGEIVELKSELFQLYDMTVDE